jgi:hypothetical protein
LVVTDLVHVNEICTGKPDMFRHVNSYDAFIAFCCKRMKIIRRSAPGGTDRLPWARRGG